MKNLKRLALSTTIAVGLMIALKVSGVEFSSKPPEERLVARWALDAKRTLFESVPTDALRSTYSAVGANLSDLRYQFTNDGRLFFGPQVKLAHIANYEVAGILPNGVQLQLKYVDGRAGTVEKATVTFPDSFMAFKRGDHVAVCARD
ncbi:MAG: hypothetical protein ACON3Z_14185 [Bradymonadia bacterium]